MLDVAVGAVLGRGRPPGQGQPDPDPEPAGRSRTDLERAVQGGDALPHTEQSEAGARGSGAWASGVQHLDLGEPVRGRPVDAQDDGRSRCRRVPADVVEGLLDGAVERETDRRPEVRRRIRRVGHDGVGDVESVGAQLVHEAGNGVDGGFGGATGLGGGAVSLAQRAEEGAHLGHRLARRRLHRRERRRGGLGVDVEDAARRRRLDPHHGHVVGDDVVQLTGDAEALLDDGVLLELGRLGTQRRGLGGEAGAPTGGVPGGLATEDGAAEVGDVDEERVGHRRDDRVDGAAGPAGVGDVLVDLGDGAAEEELVGQPAEHQQQDAGDDHQGDPAVAGPRHGAEQREEVQALDRQLHGDVGHPEPDHEERQRRHDDRPERPPTPERDGCGHRGETEVLLPDRYVGTQTATAAQHLEADGGQREQDQGDGGVAALGDSGGPPHPFGVEREEVRDPHTPCRHDSSVGRRRP